MADKRVRLSREQLYELVWSKPLSKLAGEFAVSVAGLAKICDRMEVPCPPRGFWIARQHGQRHQAKTPMGDPKNRSTQTEIDLVRRVDEDRIHTPNEPVPEVVVSRSLRNPHPLVARTARSLDRARPGYNGLVSPSGEKMLALEVGRDQWRRALRLLDSLLKALEKRGHSVSAGTEAKPQTLLEIGGQTISLSLKERLDRSEHQLTKEERVREARSEWSWARPYDYKPSGQLRFRADGLQGSGARHTWSDGRRETLEEKLGQVVVGIEAAAAFEHERRQRWAAQSAEWEKRRQAQEEERARQEQERQRVSELRAMADDWAAAARLRDFVLAAERHTAEVDNSSQFRAWLAWARRAADKLDPLAAG